ncbi:FAD-binding oxidoreductase, partial [Synechococcus sp. W60.3]
MAELISPPEALPALEAWWGSLRQGPTVLPPAVVHRCSERLGSRDADVVIAGGTLGILLGAALARRGWRVILIERGILRGREQEWNTSRQELQVLLELELLTPTEWEAIQVTHYPSGRIGFGEGPTWWVEGVLNVGVDPVGLLEFLKQHFLDWGGQVREQTGFLSATVHPDGIRIQTTAGQLSAQLLVDAMGHRSPIV